MIYNRLLLLIISMNFSFFNIINTIVQLPIAVVITSKNNKNWYKKNLDSVFDQNYKNYRVIYIDDCSQDNTANLVEAYIKLQKQENKVLLIKNKIWLSQMTNHYRAVNLCSDEEIIVHLDGDDWLDNPNVLSYINEIYTQNNIWLTFGGAHIFGEHPPYFYHLDKWPNKNHIPIFKRLTKKGNFRDSWFFNHLRTFKAWLFKSIKIEDLMYKSSFQKASIAPDVLFMYPMLEMAKDKAIMTLNNLYVWNRTNPQSQLVITKESKIAHLVNKVKTWKKYSALNQENIDRMSKYNNSKANLIIISQDIEKNLENIITINQNLLNIENTYILYQKKKSDPKNIINNILESKKKTNIFYHEINNNNLKTTLIKILSQEKEHIILSSDDFKINQKVSINTCIRELEYTFAKSFCLNLIYSNDLSSEVPVAPYKQGFIAWQPYYSKNLSWKNPNHLGASLYRKNDLLNKINKLKSNETKIFMIELSSSDITNKETSLAFHQD